MRTEKKKLMKNVVATVCEIEYFKSYLFRYRTRAWQGLITMNSYFFLVLPFIFFLILSTNLFIFKGPWIFLLIAFFVENFC